MKEYIVVKFVGFSDFYCFFAVEAKRKGEYVIKKVLYDGSDHRLTFFKDKTDNISWSWVSIRPELPQFSITCLEDNWTKRFKFNNDEEALLWFKLNY